MMLTPEVQSPCWDADRVCHAVDSHCWCVNNPYFMENFSSMAKTSP